MAGVNPISPLLQPEFPFYLLSAHDAFAHFTVRISRFCLTEVITGSLPVKILGMDGALVFTFCLSLKVQAFFPGRFEYCISLYNTEGRVPHDNSPVLDATVTTMKTYHFY